ncbi:unnamed protein product [Calicophoron daubneyi]|uniref:Coiled-coil domain-containing protein 176 n=1 Tax=Calicophoron daubneyi TaxID=300641 RepID=A0AAV2T2G1_CALDB
MPRKSKKKGKQGKKGAGKKNDAAKKLAKRKGLEDVKRIAKVNAQIWEKRVEIAERVSERMQERAKQLADEKATIADVLKQTERDTIDVFAYLKKEDDTSKRTISKLNKDLCTSIQTHKKEKEELMAQVQENLNMLEEKLKHKEEDMLLLRRALSELIEFRDEKDMFNAKMRMMESRVTQGNVERQEIIEKMELKFFDEKLRLRQESIRSIQAIAEDAHRHVLSNLSLSIKKVYKQNMDMRIIIKYLKDQFNCMKQTSENLNQENKQLLLEKEILEATLSEKISEMKFMREKLKQRLNTSHLLFYRSSDTTAADPLWPLDIDYVRHRISGTLFTDRVCRIKDLTRPLELARHLQ